MNEILSANFQKKLPLKTVVSAISKKRKLATPNVFHQFGRESHATNMVSRRESMIMPVALNANIIACK
jgi:hypothetical protein